MKLLPTHKVYVAGHKGLAGSAIVAELRSRGYQKILIAEKKDLDLRNESEVFDFFDCEKPDVVFLAAAKVGGIMANNTCRTEFLIDNLKIQNNVIMAANHSDCHRLLFLGSSCVYPRECAQPILEQYLLTNSLEYTNRPYALAKITGLELIHALRTQYKRDYFSVMPTNLYGPRDNYSYEDAHVIPALMRRFLEAREASSQTVTLFGTGNPRREFMHSADFAQVVVELAEKVDVGFFETSDYPAPGFSHINIGTGTDVSIRELAELIKEATGFAGTIDFDTSKPDGTPRKLLDVSLMRRFSGLTPIDLKKGLKQSIAWLESNREFARL